MRSAGLRHDRSESRCPAFTIVRSLQTLMFSAEVLPRLATSSNSTVCPSLSVDRPAFSTAEIWTNTSLPPPLGWMNPYPLVGLNHFTVPLAIHESPQELKQLQTIGFRKPECRCAREYAGCAKLG